MTATAESPVSPDRAGRAECLSPHRGVIGPEPDGSGTARQPVEGSAQARLEAALLSISLPATRFAARIMKLIAACRQQNAVFANLRDLCGICVQVAARKRMGVNDQAFEDVPLRHHVLGHANTGAVPVVHRGAVLQGEVCDRRAELFW